MIPADVARQGKSPFPADVLLRRIARRCRRKNAPAVPRLLIMHRSARAGLAVEAAQ